MYTYYDEAISDTALRKWLQHLRYLSSEAIGFAFFDDNVSFETKGKMREKIISFKGDGNESSGEEKDESASIIPKKFILKSQRSNHYYRK